MKNLSWKRRAKAFALAALLVLGGLSLGGCTQSETSGYKKNAKLDTKENVTLILGGYYTSYKAMEVIANKFNAIYPNCKVVYEYLQDYSNTLPARLTTDTNRVDLFITGKLMEDSELSAYTLDLLASPEQLDLSNTFAGMVDNFKTTGAQTHLYSCPVGGEMRVMYVNKTLLDKVGVAVPTNRVEFLAACETLKQAGYVPLQGNPALTGQQMVYPWIAHMVAEAEDPAAVRAMINGAEDAIVDYFREPLEFVYDLAINDYYRYKYVEEELGLYTDAGMDSAAKFFLGVKSVDDKQEKVYDEGMTPFLTNSNAMQMYLDMSKEDYHSDITYTSILPPVGEKGGYAYLSPGVGIAANKDSAHTDWCLEFLNFFYSDAANKEFASVSGLIPNTADALAYISKNYGIDESMIGQPKDMTFDYDFYSILTDTIMNISKCNAPKKRAEDGSIYSLEHFLEGFKAALAEQRSTMQSK